ncbi:MAG: choice-of-anchor Q domain-containing protein [Myxococcota bacterium]
MAAVATDFLGTPRPQGKGYDMGAYEFGDAQPVVVEPPPVPIEPLCDPTLEGDCLYFYVEAETQASAHRRLVLLARLLRETPIRSAM